LSYRRMSFAVLAPREDSTRIADTRRADEISIPPRAGPTTWTIPYGA